MDGMESLSDIRGAFMNHWSRGGCDTGEKGQPVQSAASSKHPGASGLQPSRVGSSESRRRLALGPN